MVACSEFNTTYNKSALPFAQSCFWGKTGGGGREPGRKVTGGGRGKSGRRESSGGGKRETTLS